MASDAFARVNPDAIYMMINCLPHDSLQVKYWVFPSLLAAIHPDWHTVVADAFTDNIAQDVLPAQISYTIGRNEWLSFSRKKSSPIDRLNTLVGRHLDVMTAGDIFGMMGTFIYGLCCLLVGSLVVWTIDEIARMLSPRLAFPIILLEGMLLFAGLGTYVFAQIFGIDNLCEFSILALWLHQERRPHIYDMTTWTSKNIPTRWRIPNITMFTDRLYSNSGQR